MAQANLLAGGQPNAGYMPQYPDPAFATLRDGLTDLATKYGPDAVASAWGPIYSYVTPDNLKSWMALRKSGAPMPSAPPSISREAQPPTMQDVLGMVNRLNPPAGVDRYGGNAQPADPKALMDWANAYWQSQGLPRAGGVMMGNSDGQ